MSKIAMLLRFYSCLFAFVAGFGLTLIPLVLLLSGSKNFKFDMLPLWLKGENALYFLLAMGVLGLIGSLAAFRGGVKLVLLVFTAVVSALMLYGYFISPMYRFTGAAEAKTMLWCTLATLAALLGAALHFQRPKTA